MNGPVGHEGDQCADKDTEGVHSHEVAVGCHGSDFPGVDFESPFKSAAHFVWVHEDPFPQLDGGKISPRLPLSKAAF